MSVKMRLSTRPTPEVTMEIEWRPARWLGSSAEVTMTHSFIQALHRSTGRLFAAAWAAEAAGQNEVAVRGACPAAARVRPMRTRAHHAHPPRATRKRSECGRSQQIYLIAAAAVQMCAEIFVRGRARHRLERGGAPSPTPRTMIGPR